MICNQLWSLADLLIADTTKTIKGRLSTMSDIIKKEGL